MKEKLPNSHDYYCAFLKARKFLRGVEPERIYSYRGENLDDLTARLPKEKVWQLRWDLGPSKRILAEEVLGLGDPEELRNGTPKMNLP